PSLPQEPGFVGPSAGLGARLILQLRMMSSRAPGSEASLSATQRLNASGAAGASGSWDRTQAMIGSMPGPFPTTVVLAGSFSSQADMAAFTASGSEASLVPSHGLSATGSAGASARPWLRRHETKAL